MEQVLKIDKVEKYYGNKTSLTKALDTISFDVEKKKNSLRSWGFWIWENNLIKLYFYH